MIPTRAQRTLGWITLGLLVLLLVGIALLRVNVRELNTDDSLINRGQQVNSCIGDSQDAIDQWRAIATFEFVHQVQRLDMGFAVDTTLAEDAERAIYALVDRKQDIRQTQLDLIEANDPEAGFTCPAFPDNLVPPELP